MAGFRCNALWNPDGGGNDDADDDALLDVEVNCSITSLAAWAKESMLEDDQGSKFVVPVMFGKNTLGVAGSGSRIEYT